MSFLNILSLALAAILAENIVLTSFLGVSPFVKGSRAVPSAVATGISVTVMLTVCTVLTWLLDRFVINMFGLGYMRTFLFVLVVGAVIFGGEIILRAKLPSLHKKFGISLVAVSTNSAILGVMLIVSQKNLAFFPSLVMGFASGIGFLLAIVLFAAVRERLKYSEIAKSFDGIPMLFIVLGLLALAFSGFAGINLV